MREWLRTCLQRSGRFVFAAGKYSRRARRWLSHLHNSSTHRLCLRWKGESCLLENVLEFAQNLFAELLSFACLFFHRPMGTTRTLSLVASRFTIADTARAYLAQSSEWCYCEHWARHFARNRFCFFTRPPPPLGTYFWTSGFSLFFIKVHHSLSQWHSVQPGIVHLWLVVQGKDQIGKTTWLGGWDLPFMSNTGRLLPGRELLQSERQHRGVRRRPWAGDRETVPRDQRPGCQGKFQLCSSGQLVGWDNLLLMSISLKRV